MSSSIRRTGIRAVVVTMLLQIIAAGCESTGPVDPPDAKKLSAPEASLIVAVSSLTASTVSWNEIDLAWPTSPSASGYQVFRSTTGAGGAYSAISATAANVGTYADKGVSPSTQYCYEIRSFKNTGKTTTYSAFSSPSCATTSPPPVIAPSGTNAVPQGKQILVTWNDNSANEDGFRIEEAPTAAGLWLQAASASANATSTSVSVSTEELVCFRVIAFNSVGPSLPSTSDCTVLPAPPTYLSAGASDPQSITLSWQDNSTLEDGYKVSRMEAGADWTDIATLPSNSGTYASYRDVGRTPDVTYTYRVQALKDGGNSELSNEAHAAIPTSIPAAAHDASASFQSGTDPYPYLHLGIAWFDASSNEDGFEIEYSWNGETDWGWFATTPANDDDVATYFLDIGTEGWPQDGCFRVIAFNYLGAAEPSNVTCAQASSPTGAANPTPGPASSVRPAVKRPRNGVMDRRSHAQRGRPNKARGGIR